MDKNRQLLTVIVLFLALTAILSIVRISISMNNSGAKNNLGFPDNSPGIGVIQIYGPITTSGESGAFSQSGGSDAIVEKLDQMQNDPKIKAVVIRINSPGGTVAATQEIFRKITEMRQQNIPVVASMSDLAASGGYYVASACSYIFANQGTITGSIGVIISSPNFKDLFEKYGISMNVIKSGRYKDILSSSRELEDDERELLQSVIDNTYRQFLKDVSLGRNMPIDEFSDYADGRIFSGSQALEYRLVDEIGTYSDSIKKAKELARLEENAPVYLESTSPFDQFFKSLEGKISSFDTPAALLNHSLVEYRYVQ
ncbi:MAG: signal peptide peptidase SppA [Spirochaetes bacterium]|nr:signal peptide peptidase SppA [Spirochaetota bacterium]MBN2770785.1 signal peptide peptidase SppA [Spirochaetota bacterium]